jgi:hypothetical protein
VRLVAISPDSQAQLMRLRPQVPAPALLVSDEGERATTFFCAGLSHCALILDSAGVIRWGAGSESTMDAPAPEALLQHAYRLAETPPRS